MSGWEAQPDLRGCLFGMKAKNPYRSDFSCLSSKEVFLQVMFRSWTWRNELDKTSTNACHGSWCQVEKRNLTYADACLAWKQKTLTGQTFHVCYQKEVFLQVRFRSWTWRNEQWINACHGSWCQVEKRILFEHDDLTYADACLAWKQKTLTGQIFRVCYQKEVFV